MAPSFISATAALTLSTGPMSGEVRVSVAGKEAAVAMVGGTLKDVSFALPPGKERL